jgi:ATP-dependent DNA helicase RecG
LVVAAGEPVAPRPFAGAGPGGKHPVPRGELLAAPVRWPSPERLARPLSTLPGIGPKFEAQAGDAGVRSVLDLLWRIPGGVSDAPGRRPLGDLEPGVPSTVAVSILSARRVRIRKRGLSVVEARVADDSGERKAVWFNRHWVLDRLTPGREFVLEGRLEKKGFVVSAEEPVDRPASGGPPGIADDGPRARHSAAGDLGPARWRRWAWQACEDVSGAVPEALPAELLARHRLPGAVASIREAHFPSAPDGSETARRRLAYEELFLHQAVLADLRSRPGPAAPAAPLDGESGSGALADEWLAGLPFPLTGDQSRALAQIGADLAAPVAMRRLLMGEVGSGKTVVAIWAMLRAVGCGRQAALMAPTGVLAEQHWSTVSRLLRGTGVEVGLLTGATPASERRAVLERLASGEPSIVIGTHALLEQPVRFGRLAVAVVDEEHRFGVRQRAGLESKAERGLKAHLLHLSATPIPRSLALTSYGDLKVSELRELPSGRLPVTTRVAGDSDRDAVFAAVRAELDRGRQAFVVCPLVEESEAVSARAAEAEADRLRGAELAGYEVGLIHGRMPQERKEVAMKAFEAGSADVLVATTVIEVGIDVPNATAIVIEGAERFGVAQLHQLRGRVGRGPDGGSCWLMSSSASTTARRRLAAVAAEPDGFRLAEFDLASRGEGELTGTRQHGLPGFRVATLPSDTDLLEAARADLDGLLDREGGITAPYFDLVLDLARRRYGPSGALVTIPDAADGREEAA